MNIGAAAGAGIAAHPHARAASMGCRANFMSVIGETRVLPEALDVTWERMSKR